MKMNKRLNALFCGVIFICVLLTGCNPNPDVAIEIADQEQFLEDMAKGIEDRQSKGNVDTVSVTREEQAEHYEKLVLCELEQIQKYETKAFEDEKFDTLAHLYISACEMQYEATQNYKNEDLFTGLWEGGLTARSGLICAFYDRYDLPISPEQIDVYKNTVEGVATEVEYSISGDTDFLDFFGQEETDIVLLVGDLLVVDTEVVFDKGYSAEFDRYEYSFTVKNNSEYDLESISIDCIVTDLDGNLLGSETIWVHNTLPSGKTAIMEGAVYLTDYSLPICIVPDKFAYDGNGDSIVYEIEADAENAKTYTICLTDENKENLASKSEENSTSSEKNCEECGKKASKSYINPFSGEEEYYCQTHYDEIIEIFDMMESDVGGSSQSKHTCMECNKEGTHAYEGFTGQVEYYCTEHYEELMELLKAFGME